MKAEKFIQELINYGHTNFYGVPDSLMSSFSKSLQLDFNNQVNHIITQNEGAAVGIAIGEYVSTKKISVIYLQNSGIGNIINPLTSLAAEDVYDVPLLFLIGWRGKPGFKDEPQHKFQGKIMLDQLKLLGIEFQIISKDKFPDFDMMKKHISSGKHFAFVVEENFFEKDSRSLEVKSDFDSREKYILEISSLFQNSEIFVSTTGKTSRELYFINKNSKLSDKQVFYSIGGMGHASSIALGIAKSNKNNKVILLDGDGALLMHMGILPIIGNTAPTNFYHFVLNNSSHESVGNQPTVGNKIDLEKISIGSNYKNYFKFESASQVKEFFQKNKNVDGPAMFELVINQQSDSNLGRPEIDALRNTFISKNS